MVTVGFVCAVTAYNTCVDFVLLQQYFKYLNPCRTIY